MCHKSMHHLVTACHFSDCIFLDVVLHCFCSAWTCMWKHTTVQYFFSSLLARFVLSFKCLLSWIFLSSIHGDHKTMLSAVNFMSKKPHNKLIFCGKWCSQTCSVAVSHSWHHLSSVQYIKWEHQSLLAALLWQGPRCLGNCTAPEKTRHF